MMTAKQVLGVLILVLKSRKFMSILIAAALALAAKLGLPDKVATSIVNILTWGVPAFIVATGMEDYAAKNGVNLAQLQDILNRLGFQPDQPADPPQDQPKQQ